jgi:hypothetical protein
MKIEYTNEWFSANARHFDEWYSEQTFPLTSVSMLCIHCSDHFDKWFNSDTFDWNGLRFGELASEYLSYKWNIRPGAKVLQFGGYLQRHCLQHIDKWYDENRFDHSKQQIIEQQLEEKMSEHLI